MSKKKTYTSNRHLRQSHGSNISRDGPVVSQSKQNFKIFNFHIRDLRHDDTHRDTHRDTHDTHDDTRRDTHDAGALNMVKMYSIPTTRLWHFLALPSLLHPSCSFYTRRLHISLVIS
jgi:hypothetical protein